MNTGNLRTGHFGIDASLVVAGLTGLAVPFLPFTFDVSPLDTIDGKWPEFWQLGAPFFLTFLVSAASLRQLVCCRPSKAERAIAYTVAMAAAGIVISVTVRMVLGEGLAAFNREDWFLAVTSLAILLFGTGLLARRLATRGRKDQCPILALQVAYLANYVGVVSSILGTPDNWQSGAYVALVTAVVYVADIIHGACS